MATLHRFYHSNLCIFVPQVQNLHWEYLIIAVYIRIHFGNNMICIWGTKRLTCTYLVTLSTSLFFAVLSPGGQITVTAMRKQADDKNDQECAKCQFSIHADMKDHQ